jgi:hypothetical protein
MLLAQETWNRQAGTVKRISRQVLTVEFAALVWDSSVNGALRRSYVKQLLAMPSATHNIHF